MNARVSFVRKRSGARRSEYLLEKNGVCLPFEQKMDTGCPKKKGCRGSREEKELWETE